MPTLRPIFAILLGALLAAGCAATSNDGIAAVEGELGEDEGDDIRPLEAEGVLLLVNDRAVTADALSTRARLGAPTAKAIVDARATADGKPRWFKTLAELQAIPGLGRNALDLLVADARANGYIEADGFEPPTSARLSVPDGLGRPPTAADVTVEAGFDGKSPDAVLALVRGRLMNTVDTSNERFVNQTIRDNHKSFTIALGNFFANNSPPATFVKGLQADRITLLGTMSALNPTIIMAEKAGVATYYARGEGGGGYREIPKPNYPIIMRSRVRPDPAAQGVRLFYPAWSAKVLEEPTTIVTE